ncbi:MAG: lipoyl synthase [Vampirovibrionia bacterium]
MSCHSSKQRQRLPDWLKRDIVDSDKTRLVRKLLKEYNLNTVCDAARCPNKPECYAKNTATFMILGNSCTRQCRFCAVEHDSKPVFDVREAESVAEAVKLLNLRYVVLTSVTRDDLNDGGASHFADVVSRIKDIDNKIIVEVLVPDFLGNFKSVDIVVNSGIDVFNHNIETIKQNYDKARPQAVYQRSLDIINYAKNSKPKLFTKSGFMIGLGESYDQIEVLLSDLSSHNCDIVTIGQYIQPTKASLMVDRYYTEAEFEDLTKMARQFSFKRVVAGPLVRSSYKAFETYDELLV